MQKVEGLRGDEFHYSLERGWFQHKPELVPLSNALNFEPCNHTAPICLKHDEAISSESLKSFTHWTLANSKVIGEMKFGERSSGTELKGNNCIP